MSLIWYEGFESNWTVSGSEMVGPGGYSAATVTAGGGNGIGTPYSRSGAPYLGAVYSSSGGWASMYGQRAMALGNEFIMQGHSLWLSSTRRIYIMGAQEGATRHIELHWEASSGTLNVVCNGVTRYGVNPGTGLYHFIECKAKIANSGYIILRVDGVEVLNTGTIDTLGTGTGVCDTGWIMDRYPNTNTTTFAYFDDFAFASIDGTTPGVNAADWIGDAREVRLDTSANSSPVNFTPLSSTNESNIDDGSVSDDDTTYNRSATPGDKDLFTMGNLPVLGNVLGVKQMMRARKDDAGSRTARGLLKIDGTEYESGDHVLLDNYQTFVDFYTESPDTSAPWDRTEVDAIEAGYKVEA